MHARAALEGKKIRLGELGDFSLSLSSKGAETAEKFSSQNIQRVTVCWEPGSEFRNLLADAEFNLVATRSAQAAVLKAIKEGKTNVDISAPINPDGDPSSRKPLQPGRHDAAEEAHADGPIGQREPG